MKIFKPTLFILFLALFKFSTIFGSCSVEAKKGETFYTLFSFFYEKDHHYTTNYRKGTLIPINTPVTFLKANRNAIKVLVGGKKIWIVNVPKFSGENINGIFNRTFSRYPISLENFTFNERENILLGKVERGMRKEAVLLALGYPPSHKTPSLASCEWRYWKSKFGTFIVSFTNDIVSDLKGISEN